MGSSTVSTKEPETTEETRALHDLRRSDPQRYLQIVNGWIASDPQNANALFERHLVWMDLGHPMQALADMDKVIALTPKPVDFLSRGDIHRHLGEYDKALEDYDLGESMDPAGWEADALGLLFQADCHARLGDAGRALACCARLPDDFWTPGLMGAPAGGKADVAETLGRIATDARSGRNAVGRSA